MPTPQPETECPCGTEHPIVPREALVPFILVASCFALWGMLNMITDTLVPAVQKIFSISTEKSSYIQVVNYASYALLAFPAAVFRISSRVAAVVLPPIPMLLLATSDATVVPPTTFSVPGSDRLLLHAAAPAEAYTST